MTCKLCDKKNHARGYCTTHYFYWRAYGDATINKSNKSIITKPMETLRKDRKAATLKNFA